MKSFIAAVIIIAVILVAISINAYATGFSSRELLEMLERVKQEQTPESYESFKNAWSTQTGYFSLTTDRKYIEKVEEGMDLIDYSFNTADMESFARGINITRQALVEIERFSSFDFEHIL